jgi:hypothetical protein
MGQVVISPYYLYYEGMEVTTCEHCQEPAVTTCPNGWEVCQEHAEIAWAKDGIHS